MKDHDSNDTRSSMVEGRPAANLRAAGNRAVDFIGQDAFRRRYPSLSEWLWPSSTAPNRMQDLTKLFRAIRLELSSTTDQLDHLIMWAARLDLQALPFQERLYYRDAVLPQGKPIRDAISSRTGLPFATANYLCHLSNLHKYVYLATPKVGCTAIKHKLQRDELGGALDRKQVGEEHFSILSPLLSPIDNPSLFFEAAESDEWLRFTFVRDPFVRILSCYIDKIVNNSAERARLLPVLGFSRADYLPTFKEFLQSIALQREEERDVHWASQAWLTQTSVIKYDFIGRMESFQDDYQRMCRMISLPVDVPALRNPSNAEERLGTFYGPDEVNLVRQIYADDFVCFGYSPEKISAVKRRRRE